MKFFLEGATYKTSTLKKYLSDDVYGTVIKGNPMSEEQILDCVGYCLSKDKNEHIFLLPKVFIKDKKAFGVKDINPSEALDYSEELKKELKNNGWNENVVSELPIYLYLAIEKYRKRTEESSITYNTENRNVMSSKRSESDRTLLDVIFSLRSFYQNNQNLFVLIYKQSHSGFNKVNWTKTVSKKTPAFIDNNVIYPSIISNKKEINYDEELLVIFFNTLLYIKQNYGFDFKVDQPYNLMSMPEFSRKIENGIIRKRLESIRNSYYNDKLIELWQLLHIFTDKKHNIKQAKSSNEFLLVRKFNIVFEAMIDNILGDTDVPKSLIRQADGKIVDHLFRGSSVLGTQQEIYYIGDSKYYKEERHVEGDSLFKQYTYAKNIIQQEINWYHKQETQVKYRDELTEGYNITPNFFICGFIDKKQGFSTDTLLPENWDFKINYQFSNRIFDRDTLFLRQYNINFLFVLYAYVTKSSNIRSTFKEKAKGIFKEQLCDFINKHYDFYVLKPLSEGNTEQLRNLIRGQLFWHLNGKIISPYSENDPNHGLLILGLENPSTEEKGLVDLDENSWKKHNVQLVEENTNLLLQLEEHFIIREYRLGTDPYIYYSDSSIHHNQTHSIKLLKGKIDEQYVSNTGTVIVGCYRSKEQLEWILKNHLYNIRYTKNREGTVYGHSKKYFTASYLVLYDYSNPNKEAVVYSLKSTHKLMSHHDLQELDYPFREKAKETDWYFVYIIEGEIQERIKVLEVLKEHPEATDGSPLFMRFKDTDA